MADVNIHLEMTNLNIQNLYLDRAKRIMSLLGVWVSPEHEWVIRKLYRYFMLSLQFLFLLFQIIYMAKVMGDLEEVSQASFLLFTQACLCFKVAVFEVNMIPFKELLAQMNSQVFKPQTKEHEKILKLQASRIKRLLLGFMISSQTTCSLFALRPLFDDANRNFPFKMWMPVKPEHSPQYEVGFLFQLLTISMSAFMYFGVDSACLSMVIFGCAQMEIIKEKLMSIKSIAERKVRNRDVKRFSDEHYKILVECIVQHQAVVTFIKLLENTFHSYLFFQLSGSIGLICMTALRILVVEWKSVQFFSMVLYLAVMCCQLFVCCWSGHELTATSSELHTVLYECCWYEQDLRFKRAMLFAMLRASRPIEFRAGRYVTLSRQTFVSILRMSYSYFAVLKQTNSRNEVVDNIKSSDPFEMSDNVTLFLNRPRNILLYFGVWLPPANYSFLYAIYTIFIMISQYSFVLFEFIYIADVWGDLDAVSEASFLLFTQASVCYKATKFIMNKSSLILLLQLMGEDVFKPHNAKHKRFLATQSRTIKRLCLFFLTSAVTTCTLWGLIPVADNTGEERFFPFRIWMPVGSAKSPHYELGYFYQMAAIYISAFLFIGVDSVALTMIMFGCAQVEIIMDKVKQIQVVPLSGKLKQEKRNKRIKDNYALFKECIKHHQAVIKFIETVEDTYHANIFFQLSGSVAIICIIGLRISITTPGSVQFISMLNYMVTMLSQLFLYCWCGNELTIRSELLREVMYLSPWYEQSNSFRRLLWVAMERMKQPIIFKAGHYIPLSRPTFVAILRSSYSYFAVLNQAQNKQK